MKWGGVMRMFPRHTQPQATLLLPCHEKYLSNGVTMYVMIHCVTHYKNILRVVLHKHMHVADCKTSKQNEQEPNSEILLFYTWVTGNNFNRTLFKCIYGYLPRLKKK